MTAPPADSLVLELAVPAEVRAGDPVRFALRVGNPGSRPLDLYLLGRTPTLDLHVARSTGDPVWHRLEGEIIPAVLQVRTLGPGESFEVGAVWDQRSHAGTPAGPGEYAARAELLVEDGRLVAPPMAFRIERR